MDVLHDKISQFVSQPEFSSEFGNLKIENDMLVTFFDEINKMSDQFTFAFIETLKKDMD